MNYQTEAIQTKSTSFYGNLVGRSHLLDVIYNVVQGLQELDTLKKALFYGKTDGLTNPGHEIRQNCNTLQIHNLADGVHDSIDTLHAIIGLATEAGEQLEALLRSIDPSIAEKLDRTNIIEETGDVNWYMAVLAEAQGFTLEHAQAVNIAKLRKRYPQKYTDLDAMNRDLAAERKELEATPIEKFMQGERAAILGNSATPFVRPAVEAGSVEYGIVADPMVNVGPNSK